MFRHTENCFPEVSFVAPSGRSCYNSGPEGCLGKERIIESAKSFYSKVKALTETTPIAIATIIQVRGSVPREVGTKMIVHPLGQHYGTVGGGCGEADVIKAGLNVLETGQPQVVEVDLTEDISMQSLGVCGGIMDVYVERWPQAAEVQASDQL